jgi:hypothetical protein
MRTPVKARRLTEDEGQSLLRIVRRGSHGTIRVRRAMMILASASGTPVIPPPLRSAYRMHLHNLHLCRGP